MKWRNIKSAPKTGDAFLITCAGPVIDICWWDGENFRDYFHKQIIKHEWPYMVAWKPLGKAAKIGKFKPKMKKSNKSSN